MALKLAYEVDTGATGEYWKISRITSELNRVSGQSDVQVVYVFIDLYLNADARLENKTILTSKRLSLKNYPNTVADAYKTLKGLPDFENAEDV